MFLFTLTNLTKKFRSNKKDFTVVDHVSLKLPTSGLVSIVGKSGCGKSTLLNMIMGIEKPSSGSIYFKNLNIRRFSKRKLSLYRLKNISMIYQHYNLVEDLNVLQNVAIPLLMSGKTKEGYESAKSLLKKFNLDDLTYRKIDFLSGGEKQRISILRALITNPDVILCDEPTGALDEKNSLMIMEELKKISNTKLVLMVSHNTNLVERFSDRIITMKSGKVVEDKAINETNNSNERKYKKIKYNHRWIKHLILNLFKRNKFKLFFSFVSLVIGLLSVFVGVGFIDGSKRSQQDALIHNLSIGYSTVSETTYYSLSNSPLQFKKNVRPETSLVDEYFSDLDSVQICPNFNYVFTPFPTCTFNGQQIDNFEMVPLLESFVRENFVYPEIAGDFNKNSLENIIVNNQFLEMISIDKKIAIGQSISIQYETNLSCHTFDLEHPLIYDDFSYSLKLNIVDVVDEFSFMNSPKIYYCYDALESWLKNNLLFKISQFKGENVSVYDFVSDSKSDSAECSYSSFSLLKNLNDYETYYSIIKETTVNEKPLQIESKVYTISDSYNTFISSFKDALIFFLIIGFIGVLFILGMISLSNFLENKKQSAILTCLGARTSSISLTFLFYNLIISLSAFALSFGLSFLCISSLNLLIQNNFGLSNLITNCLDIKFSFPFGFLAVSLAVVILSTVLFTLIPIFAYKNFSISEELRDE